MASSFKLDVSELEDNLEEVEQRARQAILMYAKTGALTLQNYARRNAPWTDRTAHARQRLEATAEEIPNGAKITLAHGVDYGIWLELAHEKRYAIIEPTIRLKGPEVIQGFENLMSKMGFKLGGGK